jgi:hypothetical protein
MKRYAVLDNDTVTNVIIAASQDIAELATGSSCVLVTNDTKEPYIGLKYVDGVFEQPLLEDVPVDENYVDPAL